MLIQGRQTVQIEGSSLSSRRLHFNVTKSSTISGANLFLSRVTTLPATENTRSDLEEAARMGKMTLANSANLKTTNENIRRRRRKGKNIKVDKNGTFSVHLGIAHSSNRHLLDFGKCKIFRKKIRKKIRKNLNFL